MRLHARDGRDGTGAPAGTVGRDGDLKHDRRDSPPIGSNKNRAWETGDMAARERDARLKKGTSVVCMYLAELISPLAIHMYSMQKAAELYGQVPHF